MARTSDRHFRRALVERDLVLYAASALDGDYNADGVVDAADYTVWRDTLGMSGFGLAADGDGNAIVNALDYDVWRNNFGASAASAALAAHATPEPSGVDASSA